MSRVSRFERSQRLRVQETFVVIVFRSSAEKKTNRTICPSSVHMVCTADLFRMIFKFSLQQTGSPNESFKFGPGLTRNLGWLSDILLRSCASQVRKACRNPAQVTLLKCCLLDRLPQPQSSLFLSALDRALTFPAFINLAFVLFSSCFRRAGWFLAPCRVSTHSTPVGRVCGYVVHKIL